MRNFTKSLVSGVWFLSPEAEGTLRALWELSGELSGSWGAHGGFKGILDRKCSKFIRFYNKNGKNYNFA